MTSTEATVRAQAITAIQGIASASLDLDPSTIADYLLEYQDTGTPEDYLITTRVSGSSKSLRKWAVQVTPGEEYLREGNAIVYSRVYEVLARGYYGLESGSDVNLIIDHARLIRGALKALGIKWGSTVDRIKGIVPLSLQIDAAPTGRMIVGDIRYQLESWNPSY